MGHKTAVLAGIGRLGVPITENLVRHGWRVSASYRAGRGSENTVQELAENLGADTLFPVQASITEPDGAEKLVAATLKRYGRIDALLCIASGYPAEKQDWRRWESGEPPTDDDWKFYNSNFFSARHAAISLLHAEGNPAEDLNIIFFSDARSLLYMDQNILDPYSREGGIIEVTQETARSTGLRQLRENSPRREVNPYTLAKRDLGHLAWVLARKFQGGRNRVNVIAPGPIIPPPDKNQEEAQAVVDQTLLRRWGGPDPVVKAVDFFLETDFLSGEILRVDGGFFLKNRFENG